MRFGSAWALCEPYGSAGFVTRFVDRDGIVGARFFEELAEKLGAKLQAAPPGAGVVASLDQLASAHFRPADVHPRVRQVYERTSAVTFIAKRIRFSPLGRIANTVFNRLFAGPMQQLDVPLDPAQLPQAMRSDVSLLDLDRDGQPDYRIWLRRFTNPERVFYLGAMRVRTEDAVEGRQSYLDVVLPMVGWNLTVVFRPINVEGGGLSLRSWGPEGSGSGIYIVVPAAGSYSMAPFIGLTEEIRVGVDTDRAGELVVSGTHHTWWCGMTSYVLDYTILPEGAGSSPGKTARRAGRRPA
jgi:hypothetical protein